MPAAEAVEQERMKSDLQKSFQTVFNEVIKSTEAYQLNVDDYFSSFGTVLTQDIRIMCALIEKPVDMVF